MMTMRSIMQNNITGMIISSGIINGTNKINAMSCRKRSLNIVVTYLQL